MVALTKPLDGHLVKMVELTNPLEPGAPNNRMDATRTDFVENGWAYMKPLRPGQQTKQKGGVFVQNGWAFLI